MATFIDQRKDKDIEDEEITSLDETPKEEQLQEDTAEEQSDIPEKYQGKSLEDIVRMHQEAEKLLGRQSSEVGELRKSVDTLVQTQLAEKAQAHASTAEPEIDFFEDPRKAVDHAINNHPKLKQAEAVTAQLQQSEALARLTATHPDYSTIVQQSPFLEWVEKSKFRANLLYQADKLYNFEAADELLTSWKERQEVVNTTKDTENQARKQSVKSASTGSTKGSAETTSRKVYRRADIIKLMQTDNDRYMSLAEEIRQAYAEGRVR
tara:strand:+ start:1538 stop:2332 length:795 start_codon:yes stop_codon:yes gene_type:complete